MQSAVQEPTTTVQITFQTPNRVQFSRPSTRHRRHLEDVPRSTARQMARDFASYENEPSTTQPHQFYTYSSEGGQEEVSIALDFEEVVSLQANN